MAFSDPEHNIAQFKLDERMTVADLGAGSGAYTIAAAERVRDFGRVYAVEVQRDLLPRIKNLASSKGLSNVEVLWGDIEGEGGTKIADGVVDAAIVSNILFQVEDKKGFIKELRRILKSGGKVLVVDWKDSFGNMGPAPDAVYTAPAARELFEKGGFAIKQEIDAGDHHYGFVALKEGGGVTFENKMGN